MANDGRLRGAKDEDLCIADGRVYFIVSLNKKSALQAIELSERLKKTKTPLRSSSVNYLRGLELKLLARSFRRNSKYAVSKNMAPTPATIAAPGLSPRPSEVYIDCTAANAMVTPSPKQIIAETYLTAVMLPPLLTTRCTIRLTNRRDQVRGKITNWIPAQTGSPLMN